MRDSKRDTDVYNNLLDSVGEGEGWMIWENSIETCMLSYVKQITSPGSMHETGCSGLVHWDDPEGWDGERGGRWGSWWGTPVHPWLIYVNVWQKTTTILKIKLSHKEYCGSRRQLFFFLIYLFSTLQDCSGFCHILTWIGHGCTCIPHPEPPFLLPPHPIPQGHPSAQALSTLSYASNLDWWSISHMIIYMFQCYSLKSSHPCLLPQSPKVCSLHLCLFCSLTYRVIVTIFLNSIYMH